MKKLFSYMLLSLALILPTSTYAEPSIGIKINGQEVKGDVSPIIRNSRTLVPVRLVSENLGMQVDWNQAKKEVTLAKDDKKISFVIGSNTYTKNGQSNQMDTAPTIYKDRTFLPIRVIGESLDKKVDWDNSSKTVLISDGTLEKTIPSGFESAKVVRVVDGDTLVVDRGNGNEKLRMILVNTPETVHPTKGVEFYGKEASDFTKSQLTDKSVYLEKDVSETDKYGRLLRYVWIDTPLNQGELRTKCFNAILLANGFAQVSTFPPDVKYQNEFLKIQKEARDKGLGLWGANPGETPKYDNQTINKDNGKLLAYIEANGRIIGNKNSMIYHLPTGKSYKKVSIKNAVFFNTEEEALAAGFRKAKK